MAFRARKVFGTFEKRAPGPNVFGTFEERAPGWARVKNNQTQPSQLCEIGVLRRTPITQLIFFNQGILFLSSYPEVYSILPTNVGKKEKELSTCILRYFHLFYIKAAWHLM